MLFQVQAVGMARFVRQQAEVELGNQTGEAIAILPMADDNTVLVHIRGHAKLGQHVERWRVVGACPEVVVQRWLGLDHSDRQFPPGEAQCGREANGAGAGHDDRVYLCHDPRCIVWRQM